ncbi:MAG: ABC transporter ATP-binding protein [Actinomycetota bacterium]|nr:ABC transporter ATP-binding protein [Actinomycetota bacterium]
MGEQEIPAVRVENLLKSYGERVVLDIGSLIVKTGEVLVVLGPSGAGKSVLLRILNLLEAPTRGRVFFFGEEIQNLKGKERIETSRRMTMIFQDPMLFRGSVFDNVAYGLKVRRVPLSERLAEVSDVLNLVGLQGFEKRNARTLSGGEAQRVALARALVLKPELLLLDEPFANLDTLLRLKLQEDVRRLFRKKNITAIFVTHDQFEAARMGSRIAILDKGRIEQVGRTSEIFFKPRNKFVAQFVGFENLLEGIVLESKEGLSIVDVGGVQIEVAESLKPPQRVTLGLRPEDITLLTEKSRHNSSSRNCVSGIVNEIDFQGSSTRVFLDCPFTLVSLITKRSVEELGMKPGKNLYASFKATAIHVLECEDSTTKEELRENRR